jgi:hypothetical protein
VTAPTNVADLGANLAHQCFSYPETVSGRLHGPQGYFQYEAYREWIRDEFSYRCAYCLMRESWLRGDRGFQIDHCIPAARDPSRLLDYDNLVYTCPWCNQAKAGLLVPNPTDVAYGRALRVNDEGVIEARNDLGVILIQGLKLDHPDITYQRSMIIRVVRLAEEKNNVSVILRLLGCPDDLPNLRQKRPPGGNKRPAGVRECWYEKRRRGELAFVY